MALSRQVSLMTCRGPGKTSVGRITMHHWVSCWSVDLVDCAVVGVARRVNTGYVPKVMQIFLFLRHYLFSILFRR